ncbi:MAG: methyltransferase domain-containing protein [Anaerolineales bacterium]|nr:methyltransferase domain-containing protein [Anaerolineales bacterium]
MLDYLTQPIPEEAIPTIFDETPLWGARFGQLILDYLELQPNLTAIDLGCATGFPLLELAHVHGPSCQFVGIDIWGAALRRAVHKQQVYGLQQVLLVQADGIAIPLANQSVDLIVSSLGINNFADPQAVLHECGRVTKVGGRLVLTTNLTGHMREFYAVYREVLRDFDPAYQEGLTHNEQHRGTQASVVALIEGAGYNVSRIVREEFVLRYLDGSALLRHSLTRLGFLDGWRRFLHPEDEQPVFARLEAALNQVAAQAGELRLTIPALYIEAIRQ